MHFTKIISLSSNNIKDTNHKTGTIPTLDLNLGDIILLSLQKGYICIEIKTVTMSVINYTLKAIFASRERAIDQFRKKPFAVQEKQFRKLMAFGRGCSFFSHYGIDENTTYQQFRTRIPASTYEQLWPWIEKITKGEKNILCAEQVKWFARSSGTTNAFSKYIPIGKSSLDYCHMRGGRDTMLEAINNFPDTKAFNGKTLILGGSQRLLNESCGIEAGDLSSILISNTPSWIAWRKAPKPSIALLANFEEKVEKITKAVLRENITSFAGVPSWNLILLENILKVSGKDNLSELWPEMSLFMHGGISFDPYREIYRRLIPSENMNYIETYNASEGFFGVQDDKNDRSMLLMLDYGTFYEFIPMDSIDNPDSAIPLEDVRTGVNYALVISTLGGLWRYIIGDTIEFTSILPYKFIITGRTKQYLNAFGEEVMMDNVEKAMMKTCCQFNTEVNEYTIAPVFMSLEHSKGAHLWVVEFKKEPHDIGEFNKVLDNNVRELNSDYNAKRTDDSTMTMLQLKVVPKGTFYNWQKMRGKLGGQNKVPRLSKNMDIANELLSISQSK